METETSLRDSIIDLLHRGRDNAVKGEVIARYFGYKNDRLIRLTIRELIKDGVPILSSVHPPYGYYIADNATDIKEHLGVLKHRALEDLRRYRDLKRAGKNILQPHQLSLGV